MAFYVARNDFALIVKMQIIESATIIVGDTPKPRIRQAR